MRLLTGVIALMLAPVFSLGGAARAGEVIPFDNAWRSAKGDIAGAEQANAPDSGWQTVDTPHDWSIFGPFDKDASAGGAGAFLPTGSLGIASTSSFRRVRAASGSSSSSTG